MRDNTGGPRSERKNLQQRGEWWHFRAVRCGKLMREALHTRSLKEARKLRDAIERDGAARYGDEWNEHRRRSGDDSDVGTLEVWAARFLVWAEHKLDDPEEGFSRSTYDDHVSYFRSTGPIIESLGAIPLDKLVVSDLRRFWREHIEGAGKSRSTGLLCLNAINNAYKFANMDRDDNELLVSPVPAFRESRKRSQYVLQDGRGAVKGVRHRSGVDLGESAEKQAANAAQPKLRRESQDRQSQKQSFAKSGLVLVRLEEFFDRQRGHQDQ